MKNRQPLLFASRRLFRGSLLSLLTLGALGTTNTAEAQSCPPGKTCFYAPPLLPEPAIAPQNYGGDFVFYAIGSNVSGTYSFNGGTAVPFTAVAGTPLLVPFTPPTVTMSNFIVPEQRGAFIVADSPSVVVEQRLTAFSWQSSATLKTHTTGLGTRFRAGAFSLNSAANGDGTGYDFLAFYAPTGATITVTAPPGAVAPFWNDGVPGLTHTFTLGSGQTYALRTVTGVDFDGALITSTQPISLVTGGRGWFSGCGDDARDNIVPTNLLGKQFIVDDYPAILAERLRIVADTDNTQVSINGAVAATINAGEFHEPAISGVTFIETSQPVYVYQNAGKVQCELDIAMIPPVVFAPLASSSISMNIIGDGYAVIFMPTAAVNSLRLDGALPPSPQVALVPTHPEYSRIRFDIPPGNHTLSAASDFQVGLVNFDATGATGLFTYLNPLRLDTCSNGALDAGESCDDGNLDDGDGCSSTCIVEDGFVCTGEPSICTPDPCQFPTPVICTPIDDCHEAGVCDPATGACSTPEKVNGSACDDGDACTQTDSCLSGVCTSGTPVTCTASDQCHDVGVCDPDTGVCSNPDKPNGATCDDGNACTQTDACQAGTCNGGNPVTCTASDQCHDAGTCDPATGACSNPNKPDGTACNDTNACTQTDACQAGACTGTNPVTCTASDQCHDVGTCNPTTGTCSNPNKPDGTACNDTNACTQTDACQAGACTGTNPVTCTASDQCHDAGTCNPATGTCSNPNKPDGTACNDTNACTQTDACQAGACTGTNPITCTASDQCHEVGTCDVATGVCSNPNKPDGTTCNDANACTQTDACQAGTCTGANPVTCTALDQCHEVGTCDVATGVCSNPNKPDGTVCNDANACTQTDACQAGACTGANPVTCTAQDQCHDIGVCDPASGTCSNPSKPDGAACDDTVACTQGDTCSAGTCNGKPFVCTPTVCQLSSTCNGNGGCLIVNQPAGTPCPDDGNACTIEACDGAGTCAQTLAIDGSPCEDGKICKGGLCNPGCFIDGVLILPNALNPDNRCLLCNPALSTTAWSAQADGIECDNGDGCTENDICQAGECIGVPVICMPMDQCHDAGECDPLVGACTNPAKPDGTTCDDENACTLGEVCTAGACTGPVIDCLPIDECHEAGSCDPITGMCSGPEKPDGTPCTDGTCQKGVCEPGGAGGAGGGAGAGGEGGVGGGGGEGNTLEPLVGRGGGCVCTIEGTDESPKRGIFALLGMALLSVTRRARRSKK